MPKITFIGYGVSPKTPTPIIVDGATVHQVASLAVTGTKTESKKSTYFKNKDGSARKWDASCRMEDRGYTVGLIQAWREKIAAGVSDYERKLLESCISDLEKGVGMFAKTGFEPVKASKKPVSIKEMNKPPSARAMEMPLSQTEKGALRRLRNKKEKAPLASPKVTKVTVTTVAPGVSTKQVKEVKPKPLDVTAFVPTKTQKRLARKVERLAAKGLERVPYQGRIDDEGFTLVEPQGVMVRPSKSARRRANKKAKTIATGTTKPKSLPRLPAPGVFVKSDNPIVQTFAPSPALAAKKEQAAKVEAAKRSQPKTDKVLKQKNSPKERVIRDKTYRTPAKDWMNFKVLPSAEELVQMPNYTRALHKIMQTKDTNVLRNAVDCGNTVVSAIALHILAEYRGHCYLYLTTKSHRKLLFKKLNKATPQLREIVKVLVAIDAPVNDVDRLFWFKSGHQTIHITRHSEKGKSLNVYQFHEQASQYLRIGAANPNPIAVSVLDRPLYRHDEMGAANAQIWERALRTRIDVGHIEHKLEALIAASSGLGGSAVIHPPTGANGNALGVTPPSGLDRPGNLSDGGWPNTLEGQFQRLVYNLRPFIIATVGKYESLIPPPRPQLNSVDLKYYDSSIKWVVQRWTVTNVLIAPDWNHVESPAHQRWVGTVMSAMNMVADYYEDWIRKQETATPVNNMQLSMQRTAAINANLKWLMSQLGSTIQVDVNAELVASTATLVIKDVEQEVAPSSASSSEPSIEEQITVRDQWTVANILSRPHLLKQATWDTQDLGDEIFHSNFPEDWFTATSNQHFITMIRSFAFFKGDLVFRLLAATTVQYGGMLKMAFDFYGRAASVEAKLSRETISNMDPVTLDMSCDSVAEIRVPFSAVSEYLSLQHGDFAAQFLGRIGVYAFSTLYRPPAMRGVDLRLYVFLENAHTAILTEPSKGSFVTPQSQIMRVKALTSTSHSYIPDMQEGYPLALEEGYHVTRENTCRIEDIGAVYGMIGTTTWTATHTVDTPLLAVNIHPMVHRFDSGVIYTSKLGYLGRHYCYYSGTLDYRLEVAASGTHKGKLKVVFEVGPAYDGGNVIYSNANLLLDVTQKHVMDFSVPFCSPTPRKPTFLGHPYADIASTRIGTFRIYSADAISSAMSLTSDIRVNVYVRAGKDFRYSVPRNGLQGTSSIGDVIIQNSTLTSVVARPFFNGEDFNDLYKILKRYTPLGTTVRVKDSGVLQIPVMPLVPGNRELNSISAVVSGFAFWRGSLSYKFKVVFAPLNLGSFEVFHVPSGGIPEGFSDTYYVATDRYPAGDLSASGSFYGSQTFSAQRDSEWEVTVPYYSMYPHLHIPLKHYATLGKKLPFLSTNNGLLVVRPYRMDPTVKSDYALHVSMSVGNDFTLESPTAFPPVKVATGSKFRTDVVVKTQGIIPERVKAATNGLGALYRNIEEILRKMKSLIVVVEKQVDGDPSHFASMVLSKAIKEILRDAKLSLGGWLRNMLPDVDWVLLTKVSVMTGILYLARGRVPTEMYGLMTMAMSSYLTLDLLQRIRNFVAVVEAPPASVQMEGDIKLDTLLSLACGVVSTILNVDITKTLPKLLKQMGELGKSLGGIRSGVEALKAFSAFLDDNITPHLSESDRLLVSSITKDAASVIDESYSLCLEEMKTAAMTQTEIKEKVLRNYGHLVELSRLALLQNAPASVTNPLRLAVARMEKLRNEVLTYKGHERVRVDPFHVSYYGEPGIGKSAIMTQVANDFIAVFDWPRDDPTYSRSVSTDYWDGYRGQPIVLYDDLGQIAAVAPPSDLSELIDLKSNSPCQVHQADLSQKGMYFTSKMLISTTNFKLYHDNPFVKKKEALHRRRNLLVEMVKLPDRSMADGIMGEKAYCRFRFLNALDATPASDWMTYDEHIKHMLAVATDYYAIQESLVKRQVSGVTPSPVVQALLAERETIDNVPGILLPDGTFEVLNAEAQAVLSESSEEERISLLARWSENFRRAARWRDFGLLASSLSYLSRLRICEAIKLRDSVGLSPCERVVYSIHARSLRLQEVSRRKYVEAQEGIGRVHDYFTRLWYLFPMDRRKFLSTGLVALGAVAVASVLAVNWYKEDKPEYDIPLEAFSEEGYETKAREHPKKHAIVLESASALPKTRKQVVRFARDESGIDDHVDKRGPRRKVVLEGSEGFEEFRRKNPRTIPYMYAIDRSGWLPKFGPISQEWKDYLAWCAERNITVGNLESGIDDHRDVRGPKRRVVMEGYVHPDENPITTSLPETIRALSEEDLVKELKLESPFHDQAVQVLHTSSAAYNVVPVDPQYTEDRECSDFIEQKLIDNIALVLHNKSGLRMRALAIDDLFVVIPKHFFLLPTANWEEGDIFTIVIRSTVNRICFTRKSLLIHPTKDLAMYLLSARVTGVKSIESRIARQEEHLSYRQTTGTLVSLNRSVKDGTTFIVRHHLPNVARMTEADHERIQYPVGSATHILRGYTYSADTVNGSCGSVLLTHNVRRSAKIIGFHVAALGSLTRAFSELLVFEDISNMKKQLTAQTKYLTSGSSLQTLDYLQAATVVTQGRLAQGLNELSENLDIVGTLNPQFRRHVPSTTAIKPSMLQGVISITNKTEPAVLSDRDERNVNGKSVLVNQVSGYGLESEPFRLDHLAIIESHMSSRFRRFNGTMDRRLATLDEAVNGVDGVEFADCINMKSAEGPLFNLSRPPTAHNKEWLFERTSKDGEPAHYRISSPMLVKAILFRESEAKKGRRVISLCSENLKDERRSLKKTRNLEGDPEFVPKSRSFTIMPADYTIVFRRYFMAFAVMLMQNRASLGPQVGINPESGEWTALIMRLLSTSTKGFAGDFKNYDRQTPAEFFDVVVNIINAWYNDSEENQQARKVLMGEARDHYTIVLNGVVHINKGLPSGFPMTALVNSLNNDIYKYLAWLSLAPNSMLQLDKADKYVESIYYGDDNVHAIAPEVSPWFNLKSVGEFLEKHNVMLTDENKLHWSLAPPLVSIAGVTFLKRGFVRHPESKFYLAPLDKVSIEDRLLWITESKELSDEELVCENMQNSMRDAFHHGQDYFCDLKEKLEVALNTLGRPDLLPDITYESEHYRWIQGILRVEDSSITGSIFGF